MSAEFNRSLKYSKNKETCEPLLTSLLLFSQIKADREEQNNQKQHPALDRKPKAGRQKCLR